MRRSVSGMARLPCVVAILGLAASPAFPQAASPPARGATPPWPEDTTPVLLQTPDEFLLQSGPFAPGRPWSVSMPYPTNLPMLANEPCRLWCNGKMLIKLLSGSPSQMNRNVWRLRGDLSGQNPGSGYAYAPIPVPEGYSEAWERTSVSPPSLMPFPLATRLYLKADASGRPIEYAECIDRYNAPNAEPVCTVETTLDDVPAVQVEMVYAVRHWVERDDIRAAVMEMVGSWR